MRPATTIAAKWLRVTKARKCKICDHDGWCGYTEHGASCCMRVESSKPMKNGGWLHLDKEAQNKPHVIIRRAVEPQIIIDALGMWTKWDNETENHMIVSLGERLGVEPMALQIIGAVWAPEHKAWAFPMFDSERKMIGIRLRDELGEKWAVRGSKAGLFLDFDGRVGQRLYVVEGPTDCAAALSLGFSALGRPSCLGQEFTIVDFVTRNKVREVVIVADNDAPGLRGAEKLQACVKATSCIWVPPAKDLREFLKFGGDKNTAESMIRNLVWTRGPLS